MDPANVDGDHAAHRPVSQALDPDICGSSCDQNRSPALLRSLTIPVSSSRVSKLYSSALSLDICLLRLLLRVIILAEVCLGGHAPPNKHLSAQTGEFYFSNFGEYSSGTDRRSQRHAIVSSKTASSVGTICISPDRSKRHRIKRAKKTCCA